NSVAAKSGGCFPGTASVTLKDGSRKAVKDLKVGDKVLAANSDGDLEYSDFIMFVDQDSSTRRVFHVIETKEPTQKITLTAAHLLFVVNNFTDDLHSMSAVFASNVKPGQNVVVFDDSHNQLKTVTVERIYMEEREGSFAPVTVRGTIVVDHVLASCYAVIEDHNLAHWAFAPVRLSFWLSSLLVPKDYYFMPNATLQEEGVHWYSKILYQLGTWLLDSHALHPLGMSINSS
ncbi:hypothetical protein DPEC_G00072300, partial [Dallia pectoralis]